MAYATSTIKIINHTLYHVLDDPDFKTTQTYEKPFFFTYRETINLTYGTSKSPELSPYLQFNNKQKSTNATITGRPT